MHCCLLNLLRFVRVTFLGHCRAAAARSRLVLRGTGIWQLFCLRGCPVMLFSMLAVSPRVQEDCWSVQSSPNNSVLAVATLFRFLYYSRGTSSQKLQKGVSGSKKHARIRLKRRGRRSRLDFTLLLGAVYGGFGLDALFRARSYQRASG